MSMPARIFPAATAARPPGRDCAGQASIEFVVLCLLVLPLLLLTPMIGKLAELAQLSTFASRYLAFEASVHHGSSSAGWKSPAQLGAEVRERFFADSSAAVLSANSSQPPAPAWRDHRGEPLLRGAGAVQVRVDYEASPVPAAAVFAGALQLPANNLYRPAVAVAIAPVPALPPFDQGPYLIRRHSAISVDGWAAPGADAIVRRLQARASDLAGPFPFRPLQALQPALASVFGVLEGRRPPRIGRVDPDVIPDDRRP